MKRFENQVAVITGGADGLGFGIADRIASEGGEIALFDIDEKKLDTSLKKLKEYGGKAEGYKVDVSSENEVELSIQSVVTNFGKIDIMVNSAGIVGPTNTKITEYTVREYDKIYEVNLRGAFLMTKYAIKAMEINVGLRTQ